MLPVKVKMRRFNYTNYLSRHATWHQRSQNRIKARKPKSTEQYDCKLFFRLDGTCNSMVELSNSTGWDFDSTIKFNPSTGEEYCEWFVCGTEVAFDIKQVGFTVSFSWDQQAAVGSLLWMEVIWLTYEVGLDRYLCTFITSFTNWQNCSHNRTAKQIKILSSSRVITKPFTTFMNNSTSN